MHNSNPVFHKVLQYSFRLDGHHIAKKCTFKYLACKTVKQFLFWLDYWIYQYNFSSFNTKLFCNRKVICSLILPFTYLWDKITSNWGSKMDASTLETHNRVSIFMKFIWNLSLWFQSLRDWKISWGCKNSNAPSKLGRTHCEIYTGVRKFTHLFSIRVHLPECQHAKVICLLEPIYPTKTFTEN